MAESFVQVNVNITEEDARHLDRMMRLEGYDNRSAFVRRLIRLAWGERKVVVESPVMEAQYSSGKVE